MTDTTNTAPAAADDARPAPTAAEIAAAQALLADAAAAVPVEEAMRALCDAPEFAAGLAKLSAALALYPAEPSNDLQYAVMSMNRLVARYGA